MKYLTKTLPVAIVWLASTLISNSADLVQIETLSDAKLFFAQILSEGDEALEIRRIETDELKSQLDALSSQTEFSSNIVTALGHFGNIGDDVLTFSFDNTIEASPGLFHYSNENGSLVAFRLDNEQDDYLSLAINQGFLNSYSIEIKTAADGSIIESSKPTGNYISSSLPKGSYVVLIESTKNQDSISFDFGKIGIIQAIENIRKSVKYGDKTYTTNVVKKPEIPHDFVDANCFTPANTYDFDTISYDFKNVMRSVAVLEITTRKDGALKSGWCTGTLIDIPNDKNALLTANHCFGVKSDESIKAENIFSVKAFWDYRTDQCSIDQAPEAWKTSKIKTLPSNDYDKLIHADWRNDSVIISLDDVDVTRSRLSTKSPTPADWQKSQIFFLRFHHAQVRPLLVTKSVWNYKFDPAFPLNSNTNEICNNALPKSNYTYSHMLRRLPHQLDNDQTGASWKGASGSANLDMNGNIIGQLYGRCVRDGVHQPVDGRIQHTLDQLN